MASPWGAAWGSAWGDAWSISSPQPPALPTNPGWAAYVREGRKRKGRNRPIPEDEELLHPESPEPIYADDPPSAEVLSAEQFALMLTRPVQQAIDRQDEDKRRAEHRRRVSEALALLIA